MKPQLMLLLLCLIFCQLLPAQGTLPSPVWGVHLTPSGLINFYPRFRLGGQVVTGQYSYLLDISYANFPAFFGDNNFRQGYRFLDIRPEVRKFITTHPDERTGMYNSDYWGLELALSHTRLYLEEDAYQALDGEQYSFDEATRLRRQLAVHLKYGTQRFDNGRMYIDLFVGVGLRLRHLEYQDISGRVLRFDNPTEGWLFTIESKKEGWSLRPSITMGIRLGLVAKP